MYFETIPKIVRMEIMDYFNLKENEHLLTGKRKLKVSQELAEKVADVIIKYIKTNGEKKWGK